MSQTGLQTAWGYWVDIRASAFATWFCLLAIDYWSDTGGAWWSEFLVGLLVWLSIRILLVDLRPVETRTGESQ